MRIADSSALDGAKPAACSCAAFAALPQLSLVAITAWSEERTSVSVGFASGLAMPKAASDGPVATIATVLLAEPPITKPPIRTSFPVSTLARVDRFTKRPGGGRDTAKLRSIWGAAPYSVFPGWTAKIVQVPGPATIVTVDPETVHTNEARETKDTGRPDVALAVS